MGNNYPNTSKGQHRTVEVAICAWIDLLGYGSMLEASGFEPFHESSEAAVNRLTAFHKAVANRSTKLFPSLVLNDGAVIWRDLSPRTHTVTVDFIKRSIQVFEEINELEKQNGFPGARMIIAAGFRRRGEQKIRKHLLNGIGKILLTKVKEKTMTIENAIVTALMMRPTFDMIPELQSNYAFSKAYIADAGGSRKGLGGPNLFLDSSVFENNEIPKWITTREVITWSDRGLSAKFANVTGIRLGLAKKSRYSGTLNAFDVAKNISDEVSIIEELKNTRIKIHDRLELPVPAMFTLS